MLHSQKRALYKAGLFESPIPKGDTTFWGINDWINYIDSYGKWIL
ncbi:hypothetical protein AVV36_gp099 [Pectobacterium bacteriophage PM2]|uniref:Uncharacterized protein n=1 Tax=Pectobacterium bacteriophage PM2 TaxID=1429794 RepID=A0A0A0Q0E0_9CAUD|nr:hypothetical protein AVV36_gp099 [Pectobacterium bacteriophage PM2]AHY25061.1 hypothetical protein PM2_099 [Pectobacterium bacteriophage PM2]